VSAESSEDMQPPVADAPEHAEPRVEVPEDPRRAPGTNGAGREYPEGLACCHPRGHVGRITGASRDATRASRIEKAVALLEQKKQAG
jgi:uncharacterized protein YdeI (YjbR/CyaY-like superfamily)